MIPSDLKERLERHGQEHLLAFEDQLAPAQRERLYRQIEAIDFEQLARLVRDSRTPPETVDPGALEPVEVVELPRTSEEWRRERASRRRGLEALEDGRAAVVLVAGGQGSRLGFEHPKGMFPIGPVRDTPLFQIHAEKVLAWRRKVGKPIPWYIMTSPTNRAETEAFFRERRWFGLPSEDVVFFEQGTMPAVDRDTGKVLLADRGEIFTSPNGHGGTLAAMKKEGVLEDLTRRGCDLVYYFQVDNPFAKVLDPAFFGHHLAGGAEVSLKVIKKTHAAEKLGLAVRYRGRATMIEYSDLPKEIGEQTDEQGALRFWTGSIAIHVFSRSLLERLTSAELSLPFHYAVKAVPYLDPATGESVQPASPNALKFERFIFDALPIAEKAVVVETDRAEEYEPVKNAAGEHSPDVVRSAIVRRAGKWLRAAGVSFPRNPDGTPSVALEISPLAGIDEEDFCERLSDRSPITGAKYFA